MPAQASQATASVYDVKRYGAKGDDSTDDTNAINAAALAAKTAGGGVVYFPQGTYRFSALSYDINYSGIRFQGANVSGRDYATAVSVLKCTRTDSGHAITLTGDSGNLRYMEAVSFEHLRLTAVTRTTIGNGFDLNWLGHCRFVNLRVDNFGGNGIDLDEVNTCQFEGVRSELNTGDSLKVGTNSHANSFDGACAFKNSYAGWGINQAGNSNGCSLGSSLIISGNKLGGIKLRDAHGWMIGAVYFETNEVCHIQFGDTGGYFPRGIVMVAPYLNSVTSSTPIGLNFQGGNSDRPYTVHVINPYFNGNYTTARINVASGHADCIIEGISGYDFDNWTTMLKDTAAAFHDPPKNSFEIQNGLVTGYRKVNGATWVKRLAVNRGATGSRPASPDTGEMYLDSTLGKPIWYDGSNWKDATGSTV